MSDYHLDRIRISGLRVFCTLGVQKWERLVRREVIIDLTLHAAVRDPARRDDIAGTVDYAAAAELVIEFTESSEFKLLESLAEGVADLCLALPCVERVDVRIEKVGALDRAERVAVEITRPAGRTG